jgi:hypothetical protein
VTLVAIGIGEPVVAIDVARLALRRHMFARQRELRGAVTECRRLPSTCCVARLAPMIQKPRHVVGIRRPLVVRLMARITVSVHQLVVVADMA